MTKLSIIGMYLARNETQTQATVFFKVRDSSQISSTYVTRQYTGHNYCMLGYYDLASCYWVILTGAIQCRDVELVTVHPLPLYSPHTNLFLSFDISKHDMRCHH